MEDWASALDARLGADTSLSSVGLRIDGILNQSALQAVENLLFNKCLSSLTMYVCSILFYIYVWRCTGIAR